MTIKDKDIWEHYTRGVKSAHKKSAGKLIAKAMPEKSVTRQMAEQAPTKSSAAKIETSLTQGMFNPLERKREKSLRQGDIEIDARLDLHGMTQSEAFDALSIFMDKKTTAGKRRLLIITGKGRGGAGILKRSLESWLAQLPQAKLILALRAAAPQHGGDGAFYVLLRKK